VAAVTVVVLEAVTVVEAVMVAVGKAGVFDFNPLLSMVVEELLNQGALAAIILAIAAIAIMASRPTFVKPGGRSRTDDPEKTSALNCANCRQPIEKLDSESVQPYLSQTEQVAQKIGSLSFEGWRCPRCQPKLTRQDIHVRAYIRDRFRYGTCPSCQEWTVERTRKILELATKDKEGERLITEQCHCCSYVNEKVEVIPRKMSDESSSGGGGGDSWGSQGDDGGGSWSGDSGSFGSGDSGGGGDGGGW
jgi:uncharacterized protein